MAPTQEEWDALSAEEQAAVLEALPNEVTYEEMAPPEGDQHQSGKSGPLGALRSYFESRKRRVYITTELPVYYPNAPRFAPDLLVVFDVPAHKRGKWVVSAEGRGLDWVLEVHFAGDRKKDAERNVARYAQLGIPEYFLFDAARKRLNAYRLPAPNARAYVPIVPQGGLYPSAVLGLDVCVHGEGLRFFDGSAMLMETEELVARLKESVAHAEDRANEEERLRKEEERLRKEEERLRKAEEGLRKQEAERRLEVEAENARLRAELEAQRKR